MSQFAKNLLMWIIIAMVLMSIFQHYAETEAPAQKVEYSQFLEDVRNGQIETAQIQAQAGGQKITGETSNGQAYETFAPPNDNGLIADLENNGVRHSAVPPEGRRDRSSPPACDVECQGVGS